MRVPEHIKQKQTKTERWVCQKTIDPLVFKMHWRNPKTERLNGTRNRTESSYHCVVGEAGWFLFCG